MSVSRVVGSIDPDGTRLLLLLLSLQQGIVQLLMHRYQLGRLYLSVATGESKKIDITGELSAPRFVPSLSVLLPFLMFVQCFQVFNAYSLIRYYVLNDVEVHVRGGCSERWLQARADSSACCCVRRCCCWACSLCRSASATSALPCTRTMRSGATQAITRSKSRSLAITTTTTITTAIVIGIARQRGRTRRRKSTMRIRVLRQARTAQCF